MSSAAHVFLEPRVRWLLLRTGLALIVIGTAAGVNRWLGAAGLVGCVWIDAAAGWHARKRGGGPGAFAAAAELLADFICFTWAPVAWVTAREGGLVLGVAAGIFVLAGAFRLARFAAEGLVNGGYRGLPVTYNGYLIPLTGILTATVLPYPAWVWPAALLALAGLMVSTHFTVPEL